MNGCGGVVAVAVLVRSCNCAVVWRVAVRVVAGVVSADLNARCFVFHAVVILGLLAAVRVGLVCGASPGRPDDHAEHASLCPLHVLLEKLR